MENDETLVELNENKAYYEDEPALPPHRCDLFFTQIKFRFYRRTHKKWHTAEQGEVLPPKQNMTVAFSRFHSRQRKQTKVQLE